MRWQGRRINTAEGLRQPVDLGCGLGSGGRWTLHQEGRITAFLRHARSAHRPDSSIRALGSLLHSSSPSPDLTCPPDSTHLPARLLRHSTCLSAQPPPGDQDCPSLLRPAFLTSPAPSHPCAPEAIVPLLNQEAQHPGSAYPHSGEWRPKLAPAWPTPHASLIHSS